MPEMGNRPEEIWGFSWAALVGEWRGGVGAFSGVE